MPRRGRDAPPPSGGHRSRPGGGMRRDAAPVVPIPHPPSGCECGFPGAALGPCLQGRSDRSGHPGRGDRPDCVPRGRRGRSTDPDALVRGPLHVPRAIGAGPLTIWYALTPHSGCQTSTTFPWPGGEPSRDIEVPAGSREKKSTKSELGNRRCEGGGGEPGGGTREAGGLGDAQEGGARPGSRKASRHQGGLQSHTRSVAVPSGRVESGLSGDAGVGQCRDRRHRVQTACFHVATVVPVAPPSEVCIKASGVPAVKQLVTATHSPGFPRLMGPTTDNPCPCDGQLSTIPPRPWSSRSRRCCPAQSSRLHPGHSRS